MVGDNPSRDIAGANSAGVTAVWINRLGHAPGPDEP
jgi:FMN phosphatase YigB (HAD superfamily)